MGVDKHIFISQDKIFLKKINMVFFNGNTLFFNPRLWRWGTMYYRGEI